MTTRDFIANTYGIEATRERHCSSVFTDYKGNVYSYGYHYPLAFNLNGLDFINVQGYSSTTAKHIAWAKDALRYEYTPVKLWRAEAQVIAASYSTDEQKVEAVLNALEREIKTLKDTMEGKKRKNTAVYYDLESQLHRARVNYMTVRGTI